MTATRATAERNVSLVRRYFTEAVSGASTAEQERALAVLDELLAPEFVMFYNSDTDAAATRGRDQHKEFLVNHARVYPDDHWTIESLVGDENTVACQWRIQAAHAESGKRIDVRAADFFTIRDGRLAELRRFLDFDNLRRQTRSGKRG